jgi:hypothetical protein
MQIDTHNREYNGTGFKAGPEPKNSCAPPNAHYSGILECPCTDRIKKMNITSYKSQLIGNCSKPVTTA